MTINNLFLDKHQGEQRDGRAFGFIGLRADDDYQGWFFTWPGDSAEIRTSAERDSVLDSLDADETCPNDPQIPHDLVRAKLENFLDENFQPIVYLRYRIDSSRDLGSDRLHSASEAVEREWHDTEDEAIAEAESLLEEDDELILTVCEYAIESCQEPNDWDWDKLKSGSPRREIEVAA